MGTKEEVKVTKQLNPDAAEKGQTNIDKYLVNQKDIIPAFFKDFKSSSTGFFKSFGFGSSKNTPSTSTTSTTSTASKNTASKNTPSTTSIPSKIKSILDTSGLSQLPIATTISRVISYLLAIIIVVFVILLFVHYFIKPIFSLQPGSPGLIPVPGFDDGILYWDKTNPSEIANE